MKDGQTILPSFQTQILKDDLAVILTEKEDKLSLCIGGLEKITDIDEVVTLNQMISQVIGDYLELNSDCSCCEDCDECCGCEEEDCDSHVGPCYVR